jgi:hypothetical protein
MISDLDLTAIAWWKTSTAVNEKLKKLRDTKVDGIIKYAQEQQKNCFNQYCGNCNISDISTLITIVLVYNLINNTVTALNQISNSIKNS